MTSWTAQVLRTANFHHSTRGRLMPVAASPVVRAILTENINLSTEDVIKKARTKGVTAPEKSLKDAIYNVKSELRKKAAKAGGPRLAPAAARETKPEPVISSSGPASSSASDLTAMLSNVALVNAVVGACGGVEQA